MIDYTKFNLLNLILNSDSYKPSHWLQYPEGATNQFSYIESRGGEHPSTVMFGLQIFQKDILSKQITIQDIDEADEFITTHVGPGIFNRKAWVHILMKYDGFLPVRICAVPEGTVVPTHNILLSVELTEEAEKDGNLVWLVSYLETALLRAVWYGTTVATNSYAMKQTIKKYLEMTGDPSLLPFKLHDFGARGVSSFESAGIAGAAHLVNFKGSDTITGILYAQRYYNTNEMVAFSIPATEHSTMTSWGGREGEVKAMENVVDKFAGKGRIYACVSDSYDIYNAIIQHWGTTLRHKIQQAGGTLVVRPDSGDPIEVTLRCVKLLGEKFGHSVNEKGYKVLNPCVRLIQGDGIDGAMIEKILQNFAKNGWSADNIAFGCGGGLLQKVDRDTQKFAMKCSAMKVNGEWIDVFKDPITDKVKKSKKGRLMLYKNLPRNEYFTELEGEAIPGLVEEVLVPVFENGKILKEYTFAEVRANSEK
jgi:nicotinamide phosphoribosyltransferase